MKDRKKPDKFLLPHGMPSDDREFAFSSRVPPKALKIKAPYKSWHYQYTSELNKRSFQGVAFVRLTKMMKWWWRYQFNLRQGGTTAHRRKPKGFWIEVMTGQYANL